MKRQQKSKISKAAMNEQQSWILSQKKSKISLSFDMVNPEDYLQNQGNKIAKQQTLKMKEDSNQSIINAYKNSFNSSQSREINPLGGFLNQQSKHLSSADKLLTEKEVQSIVKQNIIIKSQKFSDLNSVPCKVKLEEFLITQDARLKYKRMKLKWQERSRFLSVGKEEANRLVFTKKYQKKVAFNKLFNFIPNQKNSKYLIYSKQLGTVIPRFQCKFCKHQFKKSQALGGHISKCPQKPKQYENQN